MEQQDRKHRVRQMFRRTRRAGGNALQKAALVAAPARPAFEALESRQLLSASSGVFAHVSEAANFKLVYDLNIPQLGGAYNSHAVPYTTNNAASITQKFDRVAYYMELTPKSGGASKWVYASFDAPTSSAARLGVPTTSSHEFYQGGVTHMNVRSNVAGIVTGTGLSGGRLEFWPSSYSPVNGAHVAGASDALYDFGDQPISSAIGYGSMQIHNAAAKQTLFAYNDWGGQHPTENAEVGIGNSPTGAPDWTMHNTAGQYAVRRMEVLVHLAGTPTPTPVPTPTPTPTPAPTTSGPLKILPLGDSITWGYTPNQVPTGGYRSRLYSDFTAHNRSILYQGSVVDTYDKPLIQAGEAHHEGHGAFRIDQISSNFDGVGTSTSVSSNDGGHWIDGVGTRKAITPDIILLHAGTNDILQNVSATTAASKLDALVNKITTERPNAQLFLSTIVPINTVKLLPVVKAYDNLIRTVIVPKYQKLGRHITLVDQYKNFVDTSGKVLGAHLPDTVHPDRWGYDKMGDTWYGAIAAYLAKHPTA